MKAQPVFGSLCEAHGPRCIIVLQLAAAATCRVEAWEAVERAWEAAAMAGKAWEAAARAAGGAEGAGLWEGWGLAAPL